jgi:hypothetical protein
VGSKVAFMVRLRLYQVLRVLADIRLCESGEFVCLVTECKLPEKILFKGDN